MVNSSSGTASAIFKPVYQKKTYCQQTVKLYEEQRLYECQQY
jgi:hypothetical protein